MENVSVTGAVDCSIKKPISEVSSGFSSFARNDVVVAKISRAYGECIFSLGITDEEEVRNVFAILNYISENDIEIHYGIAMGYSSSTKYQDKIKGFNDRVVMVLIRHIESFLTKIGIDMGIDEKISYSITVQNGQVNIANDNAKITATNTVGIGFQKPAKKFFDYVACHVRNFNKEEALVIGDSLNTDIKGGILSGIDTCWVNRAAHPGAAEIQSTYTITSLAELYDICAPAN